MTDLDDARRRLAQAAAEVVPGLDARWRVALERVPRDVFMPERILDPYEEWIDRGVNERAWQEAVFTDRPLITAVDPAPGRTNFPLSSASQPSVVARMLQALDVPAGGRGLEIGSGTGWNACLLAEGLGAEVVSIDIDPACTEAATKSASGAELAHRPQFITGDGTQGFAPAAPFDWIMATCSVGEVPPAWLRQLRLGGVLLTPWVTRWNAYAMLRLVTTADGGAAGGFVGDVRFMPIRSNPTTYTDTYTLHDRTAQGPRRSRTRLPPWETAYGDAGFALGLALPRGMRWARDDTPGDGWCCSWLVVSEDGGSWAEVDHPRPTPDAGDFAVGQWGPEDVWTLVESAHRQWVDRGRPGPEQHQAAVDADGRMTVTVVESSRAASQG